MNTITFWEDLTVYRPIPKSELKDSYKKFTGIIADKLKPFGFYKYGRMLIKRSEDILHIIHIDTRGSWSGLSATFKIQLSITTIYDEDPFVNGMELTAVKSLEEILPKLRNFNRLTQEYNLLADYLTRTFIKSVLPYFERYDTINKVLSRINDFDLGKSVEPWRRNGNLILFSELHNGNIIHSEKILENKLEQFSKYPNETDNTYLSIKSLYDSLKHKDWDAVTNDLNRRKSLVQKKLKIKN